MKLLPDSILAALRPRGLLKWADLHRITDLLKKHGGVQIGQGAGLEVPGGIVINLEQSLAAGDAAPLQPVAITDATGLERVIVTPGIVFAGSGWLAPTILDTSIFAGPTLAPAAEIWLRVRAQPVLVETEYNGADGWRHIGTRLLKAEIINWDAGDAVFEDTNARALVTTSYPHTYAALIQDGIFHVRLGVRDESGNYTPDDIGSKLFYFDNVTTGTTPGQPEFVLQWKTLAYDID